MSGEGNAIIERPLGSGLSGSYRRDTIIFANNRYVTREGVRELSLHDKRLPVS